MNGNQKVKEQIQGTIEKVEHIKSGESNGRKWNLYSVIINGKKYSTFDAGYQQLIGKNGEWRYTREPREGRDGKIYDTFTLDNLPRESTGNIKPWLEEEFKKVNQKLDYIYNQLKNPAPTDTPDDFVPEDMPFDDRQ